MQNISATTLFAVYYKKQMTICQTENQQLHTNTTSMQGRYAQSANNNLTPIAQPKGPAGNNSDNLIPKT